MSTTVIDNRPDNEKFPDIMTDLETTGLNKGHNAIIQVAAVKFNLAEQTICLDFFNRGLVIPPNRFWDEGTRAWWLKKREVLHSILSRGEHVEPVLRDLQTFGQGRTLWGKPTHFDYSFLESYYQEYDLQIPFFYRQANDLNSFARARYFPRPAPNWERELPFEGPAHDAIFDCIHQIKVLFKVIEDTSVKSQRYEEEDASRTVESADPQSGPPF